MTSGYNGNTTVYKAAQSGRLTFRQIFSNTFKRHTQEDALRSLGARPTSGRDMLKTWQRPWMFVWLFGILMIMAVLEYLQTSPGYLSSTDFTFAIITSLIVPFTVSLMVWEMDMHRNVSILDFLLLLFLGGLIAITLASPINTKITEDYASSHHVSFEQADIATAWTAALVEEPAKLLCALAFILLTSRNKKLYCLDGLAIGVAVGAGFAFWENFHYAINAGAARLNVAAIQRTVWGIFGSHMLYTAPFVGALCHGMNGGKLTAKCFLNPLFIATLLLGMGCHALNNFGMYQTNSINILGIRIVLMQVMQCVVTWPMLLYMLRRGINQALRANEVNKMIEQIHTQAHASAALLCRRGTFAGSAIAVEENSPVVIGRQKEECNLILKGEKVSRRHGMLRSEKGRLIYRDLGSSNGSFVNGKSIPRETDVTLKTGDVLELGSAAEGFEVA